MSIDTAIRQFEENVALTDSGTDPKGYNLYAGLLNIARFIQELDAKIDRVARDLRDIEVLVSRPGA